MRGLPTTKADIDGHGFWNKLGNSLASDGCWCDDEGLKNHRAAVEKQRQQEAAKEQWDLVDSPAAKQWAKDHGGITFRDALQAGAMAYAAAQVEFGYGPGPEPSVPVAEEEGPVEVTISRSKSPASAQHIEDAQATGQPEVVTLDRSGTQGAARAAARGRAATRRTATAPGMDRDEYPPKCCAEGGAGSSVQRIPRSDNRSAGGQLGQQIKTLPDGTKVKIKDWAIAKNDERNNNTIAIHRVVWRPSSDHLPSCGGRRPQILTLQAQWPNRFRGRVAYLWDRAGSTP